jgi:3-oxoacyl-[acyl-carrier protein] reductase
MASLQGKTALVTGASRGIGRATASALAEAGAHVLVHYGRSAQDAESLVAGIHAKGGRANAVKVDLAAPDGATLLAREVRSIVGQRLDVLVSNAGVSKSATIKDHTIEDFDNLFATNVRSPFFLVQQLLPVFGEGSNIIVISSLGAHAVVGKPGLDNPSILAYASTKGALETLVKNWAAILGPRGIRVNAVAPGAIDTDMSNLTKTEAGREVTLAMQALEANRQAGRCCRRRRVPGVRRSPLDNGSEYPGRRWVEALRNRVLSASDGIASMRRAGLANGKNASGERKDRIEK